MRTAATDLVGIDVPIFAFSHCRDVVAAVTNAGGFGVLGATAYSPEQLDRELSWIDEQVGAILFLASKEASYITGTVLPVGGGR